MRSDLITKKHQQSQWNQWESQGKYTWRPTFQTISHSSDELINASWFAGAFFVVSDVADVDLKASS